MFHPIHSAADVRPPLVGVIFVSRNSEIWISLFSLFTANNLESINEDAFLGLPHLEYL